MGRERGQRKRQRLPFYDSGPASLILSWIQYRLIKILNVAGPRASKDPDIYGDVFRILEMTYRMSNVGEKRPDEKLPKTRLTGFQMKK